MADHGTTKDKHKTIEDYGLRRVSRNFHPSDVGFAARYFDPGAADWANRWVIEPKPGCALEDECPRLSYYAVSPSQRAYVTVFAALTVGEDAGAKRLTGMRYRDMAADGYRAAGGDLRALRWLGATLIINGAAGRSIAEVFRLAGRDVRDRGVVEVALGDGDDDDEESFAECVRNNPFARGAHALVERYADETGNAFISRFIFVAEGSDLDGEPRFHMLAELGRPTP